MQHLKLWKGILYCYLYKKGNWSPGKHHLKCSFWERMQWRMRAERIILSPWGCGNSSLQYLTGLGSGFNSDPIHADTTPFSLFKLRKVFLKTIRFATSTVKQKGCSDKLPAALLDEGKDAGVASAPAGTRSCLQVPYSAAIQLRSSCGPGTHGAQHSCCVVVQEYSWQPTVHRKFCEASSEAVFLVEFQISLLTSIGLYKYFLSFCRGTFLGSLVYY